MRIVFQLSRYRNDLPSHGPQIPKVNNVLDFSSIDKVDSYSFTETRPDEFFQSKLRDPPWEQDLSRHDIRKFVRVEIYNFSFKRLEVVLFKDGK